MLPYHIYDLFMLLQTQWKTYEEIKILQETKLKKLIHHAYRKVPYYRELFDSIKIKPQDIQKIEDLQVLPMTSKKQMQELSLKEKISKDIDSRKCKSFATSGTTGIPLTVYYQPGDWTLINLGLARAFIASGMRLFYKRATFSGREITQKKRSWFEYLGVWRGRDVSVWKKPEEWIEEIQRWKPHALVGYVRAVKLFAEAAARHRCTDIAPKIIFCGAGVLDDLSRQFLKSVFHCKIVDYYGSFEAGCIAWECEKCSGYHVSSDTVIVEVLREGKPVSSGEEGDVVITNLHSYAMPFIRYRQGDVVTLSNRMPVCGRGFPLLERIQGRADDLIILSNGQKIASQPFYYAIEAVQGIKKWRVVQEDIHQLKVEIEPDRVFDMTSRRVIEENLRRLVGNEMAVEISLVNSIPTSPSTKYRPVSSKISESL